ncbi:MAG: response regulator [Candidatus Omnitrophica bacterium]|nr:response regulator [Candidatus Omnitrophota bacterium]
MKKINVLFADDEVDSCHSIQKGLSKQGFNVDIAFDGRGALDRLKTNNYNFIFLDYNMPQLTGAEVAKIAKQRGLNCVIVMMTGNPIIDELVAKALGVDEYLKKPFSLDNIRTIIDKYIKD